MFDTSTLLNGYDSSRLSIGYFGGRSALDIAAGAKAFDMQSIVVARKGAEKLYTKHFRSRSVGQHTIGCVDTVMEVDDLEDIIQTDTQQTLRNMNTIFVQNKYFWRRFPDYNEIENNFNVPLFGSRSLLKLEGKKQPYTQRDLLTEAGLRVPRRFTSADQIDRLCIVKVQEDLREYVRAFFLAWDKESFEEEAQRRLDMGQISKEGLEKAMIEEYIVGSPVNFHFFFSPLRSELELVGIDMRRQTNLEGFQRLTPSQQKIARKHVTPRIIEVGHIASTLRESLVDKAFGIAEDFLSITQSLPREVDPTGKGMIGAFTLQGVIEPIEGTEDLALFGVCFRPTSCPGIQATPYTRYLHGRPLSMGERIAMEISNAAKEDRLHEVVT